MEFPTRVTSNIQEDDPSGKYEAGGKRNFIYSGEIAKIVEEKIT